MTEGFQLGDEVAIDAADINGTIIEHTEFLDGTHRWTVQYWHEGKRIEINCMARELRLVHRAVDAKEETQPCAKL